MQSLYRVRWVILASTSNNMLWTEKDRTARLSTELALNFSARAIIAGLLQANLVFVSFPFFVTVSSRLVTVDVRSIHSPAPEDDANG